MACWSNYFLQSYLINALISQLDVPTHSKKVRMYLNIADIKVLAGVSTSQIPHDILIVIFDDSHDQIRGGNPISTLRLFKLPSLFHLLETVRNSGNFRVKTKKMIIDYET